MRKGHEWWRNYIMQVLLSFTRLPFPADVRLHVTFLKAKYARFVPFLFIGVQSCSRGAWNYRKLNYKKMYFRQTSGNISEWLRAIQQWNRMADCELLYWIWSFFREAIVADVCIGQVGMEARYSKVTSCSYLLWFHNSCDFLASSMGYLATDLFNDGQLV